MTDKPGKSPDDRRDESTVSRAYRELKTDGPPASLDERILAEARRVAAAEDRTVVRVHHWRKWTMPAALAATVVLTVPLVVLVFENLDVVGEKAANRTPIAEIGDIAPPAAKSVGEIQPNAMFEQRAAGDDAGFADIAPASLRAGDKAAGDATAGRAAATSAETTGGRETEDDAVAMTAAVSKPQRVDLDAPVTASAPADAEPPVSEQRRLESAAASQPVESVASADEAIQGGRPGSFDDFDFRTEEAAQESVLSNAADESIEPPTSTQSTMAASVQPEYGQEAERNAAESGERRRIEARTSARSTMAASAPPEYRQETAHDAETGAALASVEEVLLTGARRDPEDRLIRIARLHKYNRVRAARRELGEFLTDYPDYELPDYFPLTADDAIYPDVAANSEIVPEAEAWLRGIRKTAERGEIDDARMQLAEFLKRYPDYPLPDDFPFSRDDARIEQ